MQTSSLSGILFLAGMFLPLSTTSAEDQTHPQSKDLQVASSSTSQKDGTLKRKTPSPKELAAILALIQDSEDSTERASALTKLRTFYFHPVPEKLTEQLTKSVLFDDTDVVRKEAALAMKDLDDKVGMSFLYKAALGKNVNEKIRRNAGEGLRRLDNVKLVEALVSVVTYVLRIGQVKELTQPQTIFITNGLNVNAPQGNINLPIELPNIEISYTATAVAVHALRALRIISRRDLGKDPVVWKQWLDNWKHIRDVRLAQKAKR